MKLSTIALVAPFLAATAQAVEFDVSGVKLGMDAAAARQSIEAANPKYEMAAVKNPKTGKVIGTNGMIPGFSTNANEHFQAIYDESGKVWFVGKSQVVPQGKSFGKDQMLASLTEKYGKPSYHSIVGPGGTARWDFDRAGKQYVGEEVGSPCSTRGGDAQLTPISVAGYWVQYPKQFNPKCGRVIEARYGFNPASGIVDKYGVRAFDSALVHDALVREQSAAQQKRDDAVKKELGAGNKPGL